MTYNWANFSGKTYDLPGFAALIAVTKWTAWKPLNLTLHNTGAPTLKQWVELGPSHEQRIANLKAYYQGLGWHAGPAAFISRSHITVFSGFTEPGVHSTCYNHTDLGLEMTGDFSTEPFNSGDGAMVRDTAVAAMAILYHALGRDPAGLHFHRQCTADHHACPGKNVVKSDIVSRVAHAMLGGAK